MNVKDSEIILCKGIKLDKNFENVLSYDNYDMVNLCRNNQIATSTNYSILDPTVNSMDVALPYASCIYANYIAFKNPHYGNKWFFGFVDKVKYVSNNCTTIEYKVDVFSTWYEEFNIGKAFIEREHVSDDTIGKHTLKENLNTGEFIINNHTLLDEYGSDGHVVIGVTRVCDDLKDMQKSGSTSPYNAPTTIYNGIYNGLTYYVFFTAYDASQFIAIMNLNNAGDNIQNVFICPLSLYDAPIGSWETVPYQKTWAGGIGSDLALDLSFSYNIFPTGLNENVMADNKTISLNTTLDGYTPKNNKMFTKEFNYLNVNNNNGDSINYAYEDFTNNTPTFRIVGSICPGCSIRLTPLNYKKWDTTNTSYKNNLLSFGLVGGKYPTCSWKNDTYINWITQQSVNQAGGIFDTIKNIGMVAAASSLMGSPINPATIATGGLSLIAQALGSNNDGSNKSDLKGNANAGDVTYASGMTNFSCFQMSCKYEYAKICDDFLSRFGYKVNEVKIPNLTSRQQFNYLKVGGVDELITGDIPASDLEEINNIFRKGVTIFHNYSNFGDYTINNPIVNAPY